MLHGYGKYHVEVKKPSFLEILPGSISYFQLFLDKNETSYYLYRKDTIKDLRCR